MHITVYTKPGCHLCEDVLQAIDRLTDKYALEVTEVNILDDMATYEQYKHIIPVIEATDARVGRLVAPITEPEMHAYFSMAQQATADGEQQTAPEYGIRNTEYAIRNIPHSALRTPHSEESWLDRSISSIGRHWLRLLVIAMGIFVGLPWLAPVFAALGWWDLANPIYTGYALTCHQLPERAGTLFGYQVAFCYRNTALYGGVVIFGILYGLARDRGLPRLAWLKKPLPWWGLVLLLLPVAVDGITHMLGLRDNFDWMMDSSFGSFYIGSQPFSLNWWLRIATGLPAALGVVWFAFPRMQQAMVESEALRQLYRQQALMRARQAQQAELATNLNTGQS